MEFSTAFILAQISGLLATVAQVIGVQFKKKTHILIFVIINSIFFTISFWLLGAYSGAVVCALGVLISVAIYFIERSGRRVNLPIVLVFFVIELAAIILTYSTPWDILPGAASIFWLISILQSNENNLRFLLIISHVCWAVYGVINMAYTSVLDDFFTITSSAIAMIRYRKVKNGKTKNNKR